jgi:hypothetical protein
MTAPIAGMTVPNYGFFTAKIEHFVLFLLKTFERKSEAFPAPGFLVIIGSIYGADKFYPWAYSELNTTALIILILGG